MRSFSAGLVTQLAFWGGQAAFFLVLALYLQQGRGLSALHAGLVFTVLAVAYVIASAQAPGLIARHGRGLLGAGALVLACGHGALLAAVAAIGVAGSVWPLMPGLILIGAGMGLLIVPLTTTIMSGVHPDDTGAASGALATMQNVGNAIGVAVTGVIFFGALHRGYAHALELSLAELAALLLGGGGAHPAAACARTGRAEARAGGLDPGGTGGLAGDVFGPEPELCGELAQRPLRLDLQHAAGDLRRAVIAEDPPGVQHELGAQPVVVDPVVRLSERYRDGLRQRGPVDVDGEHGTVAGHCGVGLSAHLRGHPDDVVVADALVAGPFETAVEPRHGDLEVDAELGVDRALGPELVGGGLAHELVGRRRQPHRSSAPPRAAAPRPGRAGRARHRPRRAPAGRRDTA